MSRRGCFILFEGVDRCGKTTQAMKLAEFLNTSGQTAEFMRFPDRETAIGQMISAYLGRTQEIDDRAVHLLFSANRWEKQSKIIAALTRGHHVVMDRYAYSGVAFSSAKSLGMQWCKDPDAGLPQPDVILFMRLSVDAAGSRGGFGMERYESSDFQKAVIEQFDVLAREINEKQPGLWVDVDAAGSIEEVHERVKCSVSSALAASEKGEPVKTLWQGAFA